MLAQALGTEMMAVLGVVAGFFGGLALGAFALDAPLRRSRRPAAAYAALEAAIGVWALVSIWLLPWVARTLPPLLGTAPPPALLWAFGFALPALVLLPATAAMGGTLLALERVIAATSGRVAAGVYAANTGGAVLGALASVFVLLPTFGLSGTLAALAGVNAACTLGILLFARAAVPDAPAGRCGMRLTATLFATGLLGVAFEVLVVRLAAQLLQDTIYTFAGLLAAYLLGTALGGWLEQGFPPRDPARRRAGLLGGTALACLLTATLLPRLAGRSDLGIAGELAVAGGLFLLPSLLMGALFGHLAQATRDRRGSLGWAVGINSLGAAIAPLLAATVLAPALGAWTALLPVSLGYLLLVPAIGVPTVAVAIPAALGALLWWRPAPSLVRLPAGGQVLATREGPMAAASVVEDADGVRYLEVNGHFRMGGTSSQRSDWRQAHLPLLLHPNPHRALFLGVGTGATLQGAAAFGVEATGVELVPEVRDVLPWFADPTAPSGTVVLADARRFVAADRGRYDVIVADLFHPALDGTGSLYTTEHFAAVRARLAPGGLFCQWLPLYQLDTPSLRAIVRSFLDAYPDGSAWLAHFSLQTPMLALIGGPPDTAGLASRLRDTAALRRTGFAAPMDVLGLYLGDAPALGAFAGEGPRNTDDHPVVALDAPRNVRALSAPPGALLDVVLRGIAGDATALVGDTPLAVRLAAYWRARDRFIALGRTMRPGLQGRELIAAASPGLLEVVRLSAEFEPAYAPLQGMIQALASADPPQSQSLARALREAAPFRRPGASPLDPIGAVGPKPH